MIANLVNLHDAGVLQVGDGLGFDFEARQVIAAGVLARQDHLQGDRAFQLQLPGLVYHAHAALTQGYRAASEVPQTTPCHPPYFAVD